ncbi:diguanylate cyclase [Sinorhizobium sp. BG8]|uniref:sensor domain-containing diguanylate cyclase n=1 Tax=Sinorhizobium sp. BG8 TaxID=2613773 RepID=UPI00193E15AA|nr:diguanylate cyclase [Sinorhizobium sp. BG8]
MVEVTGKAALAQSGRMKGIIGMAAVFIVVLFAFANFIVLDYAVRKTNQFTGDIEKRLVRNEFSHQMEQVVLYQSSMSFWDRSYEELSKGYFTDDFIRTHMRDWLWADFGFSWMVFVRSDGETVLSMHQGIVERNSKARNLLQWVSDLTARATSAYYAALIPSESGWQIARDASHHNFLSPALPNIHVAGLRMIDGAMSIVVVQAVVPRSLIIPAVRNEPVLMVTVKPISGEMLESASTRLGLSELGFSAIVDPDPELLLTAVGGDDYNPMVASWRPTRPGTHVWGLATPLIGVLVLAFIAVMTFIAHGFSKLVKALQESEARHSYLAVHDPLTGLQNRAGFDKTIRKALGTTPGKPFAIFAMDLDMFKAVNDRHGHAAGDEVLRTVSARFRERIGMMGTVARLGGDEFAVWLPGDIGRETLLAIAEGLVRDAQVPVAFEGQMLCVGSSAGIACYPAHGQSAHEIAVTADAALYAAKNAGRNRAILAGAAEQAAAKSARAA